MDNFRGDRPIFASLVFVRFPADRSGSGMSENEQKSPFGAGFAAACIVVGAVLVCGILLLVSGPNHSDASTGTTQSSAAGDPGAPVSSRTDGQTAGARPATPSGNGSDQAAADGRNGCGPAAGDQAVPTKPPVADSWEVSHRVVVPRSTAHGPARTDADGFRRCFAHSPTGAVYAAYNVVAALADQRQAIPTVQKLMVPGSNTDALLQELRNETPTDEAATQLAGFRVLDADHDRVTIMLAVPVESEYMSLTLTLIWYAGDWRVRSPSPGNPVGAPFSQHRDLDDFVAWSGV